MLRRTVSQSEASTPSMTLALTSVGRRPPLAEAVEAVISLPKGRPRPAQPPSERARAATAAALA
jgi:hypothetical protein